MQQDDPQDIPSDIRESLNVLLKVIAQDNLVSFESLVHHNVEASVSALSSLRQTPLFEPFVAAFASAREGLEELKPKHRTGGALAGRIRKELGITQKPPGQAKAPDKPSDEAVAALKNKHKIQALHHLIRGELSALDPAIGDAACEMRPSFLLDIHRRISGAFDKLGLTRAGVLDAVHRYETRHQSDHEGISVCQADDIANDPADAEDMALWDRLFDHLELPPDAVNVGTYLQLCKSYTEAASLTLDEFGLPVASRLRRRHPLSREVQDLEALGQATRAVMLRMVDDISGYEMRSPALDPGLPGQLSEALRSCRAFKDMEGARLPLLPIYEALYVIMIFEARRGRPLVFSTVHLKANTSGLRLVGTDLTVLRPRGEDGRFEQTEDPVGEPAMTFRCLSITAEEAGVSRPPAGPLGRHARDFVLAYAAAHPPFAEGAEVAAPACDAAASYRLTGNIPSSAEAGQPLHPWFWRHRRLADRFGLSDFRFSERVDRDTVRRTTRPVGLTPIHIYASTPGEERARLDTIARDLDGDRLDSCFDLKAKASARRSKNSASA